MRLFLMVSIPGSRGPEPWCGSGMAGGFNMKGAMDSHGGGNGGAVATIEFDNRAVTKTSSSSPSSSWAWAWSW